MSGRVGEVGWRAKNLAIEKGVCSVLFSVRSLLDRYRCIDNERMTRSKRRDLGAPGQQLASDA
jgi:hypothetical protein